MTTAPERTATLTDIVTRKIRARMGWLDIRQNEVARRMGENSQWVSTRINGVTPINLNDLARFAKALEVGLHELLPTADEAAAAPVPRTTQGYAHLAERSAAVTIRPPDNRPSGRPHAGPGRTGYVDRSARRRRGR